MKSNQELKNAALEALKGNWAPAVVGAIFFIFAVCLITSPAYCANMAAFGIPVFTSINPALLEVFSGSGMLLNLFLLYPLTLGYAVAHNELLLNGDYGVTRNTLRQTFTGYLRNVLAMFLSYLFTVLWTLLLIVPGIIKALAYSLTPFIVKDNPELSPNQAISLSVRMMKGHKLDLFCLYLSFAGWFLLCILTIGVGFLWLMPYVQTSLAAFYQDVKNEYAYREVTK